MSKDNLTPCKAIHKFCIECMGSQKGPKNCDDPNCPLFIYRLGMNPKRKGIGGSRREGLKHQSANILTSQVVTKKKKREIAQTLNKEVKEGRIKKPDKCQICLKEHPTLNGHHFNYEKPYNVIWCCPSCHSLLHHYGAENTKDIDTIRNRIGIMIDDKKKVRIIVEDVE